MKSRIGSDRVLGFEEERRFLSTLSLKVKVMKETILEAFLVVILRVIASNERGKTKVQI